MEEASIHTKPSRAGTPLLRIGTRNLRALVGCLAAANAAAMSLPFRQLFRSPAFALTALGTLALGIGVNVALFSVFRTLVLNPHRFAQSDTLVRVWTNNTARAFVGPALSWPKFEHFAAAQTSLAPFAASVGASAAWTRPEGEPEQHVALQAVMRRAVAEVDSAIRCAVHLGG